MPNLTDAQNAEVSYRVAAARKKHEIMRSSRPYMATFDEAAAFADAVGALVRDSARSMVVDAANEAEIARSEYYGALAAHKHLLSERSGGRG